MNTLNEDTIGSTEVISIATSTEVATSAQPAAVAAPKAPKAGKVELIALTADGSTANPATLVFKLEAPATDRSPLTPEEQLDLLRHESVITKGLASFIEVGKALQEIQTRRLYRLQYPSFETYLAGRWNFKRAQAYRLISASLIARDIPSDADAPLPANEGQARHLKGLAPKKKVAAMKRAQELAGTVAITADHVETAVIEIKGSDTGGAKEPKKPGPTGPPPSAPADTDVPQDTGTAGSIVHGAFTRTPKPLAEILDLLRTGRGPVEAAKSYQAAMDLLALVEAELQAHVPARRYSHLSVINVVSQPALEAMAA